MIDSNEYERMLKRMGRRDRIINRAGGPAAVVAGCIAVVAVLALSVLITMAIVALLWNVLLPMFWVDAPVLSAWQVFGAAVILMLLRAFVFGGGGSKERA